jgi:putative endonuclease
MPTWHVYILRCRDGSLYTGCTNDLDNRLAAHNAGKGAKYTASRRPVQVVYTEPAGSKSAAMQREFEIKRWTKARKEVLVAGKRQKFKRLCKRHSRNPGA